MRAVLWAQTIYRVLDVVRIEAKFHNRMRLKKHKNLSNNKSKIISIKNNEQEDTKSTISS
jgi:hypothetical protein